MTAIDLATDPSGLLELDRQTFAELYRRASPEGKLAINKYISGQTPWRSDPAQMAAYLTQGQYQLWPYIRLMSEKFAAAVSGESKRQIWNLPARYGKSVMASRWGPAWAFDRDPSTRIILVSYGDRLAMENAIAVRTILREHANVLRCQLLRDRQQMDRFVTTGGGGLLAGSIQSGISGFGADGAVIDDPFKDWVEAHSEARRDLVERQYQSVIRLRLETEDSWVIVIHTRWHEDDLTGRLLTRMEDGTGEAWELVRLPAIAESYDPKSPDPLLRLPDPLGRKPGDPLEPRRFSLAACKQRQLALGTYLWCTPAETPILMGDFTVKPISKVEIGDTVVGVVSEPGKKMRYERSTVTATSCKPGTVVDYHMESGRTIRATRDHRWVIRANRPYRPANVGTPLLYAGTGGNERHRDRVVAIDNPVDEDVYALQTTTGTYVAWGYASSNSALEQQRPGPEEGGEFKRAWWGYYDQTPQRFDSMLSSWDTKLLDRESGDYTVGLVMGRIGSNIYVLDMFRGRWTQATTANALALLCVRWPHCTRHILEKAGYAPEVAQQLRTRMPGYEVTEEMRAELHMTEDEARAVEQVRRHGISGIALNPVKGNKEVRARLVVPAVEAGNVFLSEHADWTPIFLDELSAFDNGAHDDIVDAFSQGAWRLIRLGAGKTRTFGAELRSTGADVSGRSRPSWAK